MKTIKSETVKLKAKRTFLKKGTCSRTFFYLLDREFGHPRDEEEERAIHHTMEGKENIARAAFRNLRTSRCDARNQV